jgi:hypothetical protein
MIWIFKPCSCVQGRYHAGLSSISSEHLLDTADNVKPYKRFKKGNRRGGWHIIIIYIRYVKPDTRGKEARANDQLERGEGRDVMGWFSTVSGNFTRNRLYLAHGKVYPVH